MARFLSGIKDWFVPSGRRSRVIMSGMFKGLRMNLDLRHETQIWLGLWEREISRYAHAFAHEAKTAIDVGAADGLYTLFFLSQPNIKHVFAFEASERRLGELAANLALSGFGDNTRYALAQKYVGDDVDASHCTLDSFDFEGPCVVKIDVEGSEERVLNGAAKLLHRTDVFWIIETHSLELEQACERILGSNGFTTAVIGKAWWRALIPEARPIPHNRWLAAWHDIHGCVKRQPLTSFRDRSPHQL